MNSAQLRQAFIDFFKSKDHTFAPGAPVVPADDPTLLFTNAGMNQFKDVFLGEGNREYTRAVNSQICVRVSGKHNDLEDVGKDTTHQTSFEMLGNWSFGDYYKKEAIVWAWEFLTEVLKLDKNVLYVTIYEEDDEAGDLWRAHTDVNPKHIVKCGKKDNFWEMGEIGPCGPCSEIHIDLRPNEPNDNLTEKELDSDRFIELWNLVFIQYNRQEDGSLEPLPEKHIDTGAGLERLLSIMQGSLSNYQTDLFEPILEKIETITGVAYTDDINGMPHRVLADHIRTITFAIADNVLPSNEGRGYVLRRLLRRALRYAKKLNYNDAILYQLVDTVSDIMGTHFEHIANRKDYIKTVVKAEEDSFLKTLEQGLTLFEEVVKQSSNTISGKDAFKLYDTYGFPVDLTQVLAEEKGLTVDMTQFQEELNQQREKSRTATKEKQREARSAVAQAEDEDTAVVNDEELALLYQSEYTDNIARGGEARVLKDSAQRIKMARHHTGTHVLHEALREVLGDHVQQAGSLVDTDRLRFDFTHFQAVSTEELQRIETICNQKVLEDIELEVTHLTLQEAKDKGAAALFGEKYDENDVRVVQIGDFSIELCGGTHVKSTGLIEKMKIISESAVAAGTRRIEALAGRDVVQGYEDELKAKIIAQLVSKKERLETLISQLQETLSLEIPTVDDSQKLDELRKMLSVLDTHIKTAEKQLSKEKDKQASTNLQDLLETAETRENILVIKHCFEGYDMKMLHTVSDNLINMKKNAVVVLASNDNGKGSFLVKCGAEVDTTTHNASEWIKKLTKVAGGGGGGNPTKAQAGGANPDALLEALNQI